MRDHDGEGERERTMVQSIRQAWAKVFWKRVEGYQCMNRQARYWDFISVSVAQALKAEELGVGDGLFSVGGM